MKKIFELNFFKNKAETPEYDFSNLPLTALKKIGEEFNELEELIKFSHVCKKWRSAYNLYLKPELLCLTLDFRPLNKRLLYSTERIKERNLLKISSFDFLGSGHWKHHFNPLRKLVIHREPLIHDKTTILKFSFEKQLNHFENLEHIQIRNVDFQNEDDEINLPKLKILNLTNVRFEGGRVIFNTPLLEILKLNQNEKSISDEFLHPNSLRYLEYNLSEKTEVGELEKDLIKFQNLEILFITKALISINSQKLNVKLNRKILDHLPKLKFVSNNVIEGLEKLNFLPPTSKEIKILENFYNDGDYNLDFKNLKKYTHYRDHIGSYPLEFTVEFQSLLENKTALDLVKDNFIRLVCLYVNNLKDQTSLISFLKSLKYLSLLSIEENCQLDQSFFSDLPNYLTVHFTWFFSGPHFKQIKDFSFLRSLNTFSIRISFVDHFMNELLFDLLKNKNCNEYSFYFKNVSRNTLPENIHEFVKEPKYFMMCKTCGFKFKVKNEKDIKDHLLSYRNTRMQ